MSATYSVDATRVLRGRVVVAWLRRSRAGIAVVTPNGVRLGRVSSPCEAMLLVASAEQREGAS